MFKLNFKLLCPVHYILLGNVFLLNTFLSWFCSGSLFLKQSLEEVHRIRTQHVFPDTNASLKLCCHKSHKVSQPCQCACGEKQEKYCTYEFWNLKTEAQLITGSLNSIIPHSLPRKDLLCHKKVQRPLSEADIKYFWFPSSSRSVT